MKAMIIMLLLAGLVSATECFTVGDDIEMEELDERLVDAAACGLSNTNKIATSTISTLLIAVVVVLMLLYFVRSIL